MVHSAYAEGRTRNGSEDADSSASRRAFLGAAGGAAFAAALPAQQTAGQGGKKIGYAVVGLGRLAQNQILPAFARCNHSQATALVSGDPVKAARRAAQYGVNPKNIYNYENYDRMGSNPEIQAVYVVLPNGMHAEYTMRGAKAGQHILTETSGTPPSGGSTPSWPAAAPRWTSASIRSRRRAISPARSRSRSTPGCTAPRARTVCRT